MWNKQLATEVAREIRKDLLIYTCVVAYGVIVAAVAWYVGAFDKLSFFARWVGVVVNAIRVPMLFLAYLCVVSIWASPTEPAKEFWRRLRAFCTPRLVAACATVAALGVFIGMFSTAKNLLPLFSSFADNEKQIADLDVLIHGQAVWRYIQPALDHIGARRVIEFIYGPVWFLVITGLPFMVVVLKRFEKVRQPFVITWLLCWIILGNLAAGFFLSAGPVFYGQVTGDFDRFRELINLSATSHGLEFSAYDIQLSLWSAHVQNLSYLGTGISAFPSVHVSMATLTYLLARQGGVILQSTAAAFLLIIFISSIYLGWHYAVDGYFSICATIIIWNAVSWALRGRINISPTSAPAPVLSSSNARGDKQPGRTATVTRTGGNL